MRVDRLFEIFDSAEEAVQSFDECRSYAIPESELYHGQSPESPALELLKATT
jgi:hypothetical protein